MAALTTREEVLLALAAIEKWLKQATHGGASAERDREIAAAFQVIADTIAPAP